MRKIKVIHLCPNSQVEFGIDKQVIEKIKRNWFFQTAEQIKKVSPNIEVEGWAPEKSIKKEVIKNVNGVIVRVFPSNLYIRHGMEISMPLVMALKKEIKKAERENRKIILHFHEYHSWQTYLILGLIKKSDNLKIIAQHHGGRSPLKNLWKYPRFMIGFPFVWFLEFLEKLFLKKIDVFYILSDDEENYVKSIAPNSKIVFQTMGITEEYFKSYDKKKIRKKLGFNEETRYLLFLGRIKTTKGIKELLDAMKEMHSENVKLVLVGEGEDSQKYIEYSKMLKLSNVKFVGTVYGQRKLDYLSAADALILPSHTEGAPVVIMEALARNLPVIATNVGGIPKMIASGKNGIIIPVKSKEDIKKAIKKMFSLKIGDLRKDAGRYNWEDIISHTLKDYSL